MVPKICLYCKRADWPWKNKKFACPKCLVREGFPHFDPKNIFAKFFVFIMRYRKE